MVEQEKLDPRDLRVAVWCLLCFAFSLLCVFVCDSEIRRGGERLPVSEMDLSVE